MHRTLLAAVFLCWSVASPAVGAEPIDRTQAEQALKKAVAFFQEEASAEGGYLWRYSADLRFGEGESRAGLDTVWVQPPGTPTVGQAYLTAHQHTGDAFYLDAARQTAHALVRGQLLSGGWDYRIEFKDNQRTRYAYRADVSQAGKRRNTTTLDDNTTQAALRLLMRVDKALNFSDSEIHSAAKYALEQLLAAQYPNGAWPQRYQDAYDAEKYPVKRASPPKSWSRTYAKKDYRDYYTFNDNTLADMIDVMFLAAEIYAEPRYDQAAQRAGDFILLAQMPEPQPAWAQQYDAEMHPAWARRFEPPAVTGGESQGVLRILLDLYRHTGDKRYLQPIPRAIAYLKQSQLPGGRLARFYELGTNKPLYFTKEYTLTYSSDDMPTHYGFIVSSRLDSIEREYERLHAADLASFRDNARQANARPPRLTKSLSEAAQRLVENLDARGAWVEPGSLKTRPDENVEAVIDCRTFVKNVETLGRYIAAVRATTR